MPFDDNAKLDELKSALWDNADFKEAGSVSKARAYITAATRVLSLVPENSSTREGQLGFNMVEIRRRLESAEAFVSSSSEATETAAAGGPSVTRMSFEQFRE